MIPPLQHALESHLTDLVEEIIISCLIGRTIHRTHSFGKYVSIAQGACVLKDTHQILPPPGALTVSFDLHLRIGHVSSESTGLLTRIAVMMLVPGSSRCC
jgi:hypothetical protein